MRELFTVYEMKGGKKWVLYKEKFYDGQDWLTERSFKVISTPRSETYFRGREERIYLQVFNFFGFSRLAKELYNKLGIEHAEWLD